VPYDVQTPVYEGPFDLLLHLILREEVDIHEVSLSTIVDGYLRELALMAHLDLEVTTEFLLIAATLVELKSRRLLPGRADADLDEELALWEERDLLLARLLECKTFKDVSRVLAVFVDDADRVFGRTCGPDERFAHVTPDPLEGMTVRRLERAMLSAITPRKPPELSLWHVSPVRFTVAERVVQLSEMLPTSGRTSFARLCEGMHERLEVIVTFLALLELFKQGAIEIAQFDRFGDISVEWSPETRVLAPDVVDEYEG
jgi:segregation and condensation protein A